MLTPRNALPTPSGAGTSGTNGTNLADFALLQSRRDQSHIDTLESDRPELILLAASERKIDRPAHPEFAIGIIPAQNG